MTASVKDRYGPWALVAGASDGIGASFAGLLAAQGVNLVLVARRAPLLETLTDSLSRQHGISVRTVAADLTTEAGLSALLESTVEGRFGGGSEIGLLVCNAALAPVSPFEGLPPETVDAMVELNVRVAARLTHAYGRLMLDRGRGGIVLLSSMASLQGTAMVAHYAATKAYLRVLAEGLWYEWRPRGVDVLACCPGPVATPTYRRGSPAPSRLVPPPMRPDAVARQALAALGRRPVVVPGWRNRVAAGIAARMPRRAAIALASRRTAAMYRGMPS